MLYKKQVEVVQQQLQFDLSLSSFHIVPRYRYILSFTDLAIGFGKVWKIHLLVSAKAAHFLAGMLGIEEMLLFSLI